MHADVGLLTPRRATGEVRQAELKQAQRDSKRRQQQRKNFTHPRDEVRCCFCCSFAIGLRACCHRRRADPAPLQQESS
jgi:hypothetical protein